MYTPNVIIISHRNENTNILPFFFSSGLSGFLNLFSTRTYQVFFLVCLFSQYKFQKGFPRNLQHHTFFTLQNRTSSTPRNITVPSAGATPMCSYSSEIKAYRSVLVTSYPTVLCQNNHTKLYAKFEGDMHSSPKLVYSLNC